MARTGAGVAIARFDAPAYAQAIAGAGAITLSREEIRAAAHRLFALKDGVASYTQSIRRPHHD